jgi:hypothetical protein
LAKVKKKKGRRIIALTTGRFILIFNLPPSFKAFRPPEAIHGGQTAHPAQSEKRVPH